MHDSSVVHTRIDQAFKKIEELEAKVCRLENAVVFRRDDGVPVPYARDEVESRIAECHGPKKEKRMEFDHDEHHLL